MTDKKYLVEIEDHKEALKFIFDIKNYKNKVAYFKTMLGILVIGCLVCFISIWGFCYVSNYMEVTKKVAELKKIVKEGKQKLNSELDNAEQDLQKEMALIFAKKDTGRIKLEEVMEYNRVDEQRQTERANKSRDDGYDFVLDWLQGKVSMDKGKYTHSLDGLYEYCARCYDMFQKDVFNFRSTIIAKHNLAEKYKRDVEMLESLMELSNWNQQALITKKEYIKEVERYKLDTTDEDLAKQLLEERPNSVIQNCLRTSIKAIPILVQYDRTYRLEMYLDKIKKTADFFGIAKEIDWTVPLMVKKEEKDFENHMQSWHNDYCTKNSDSCRNFSDKYEKFSKDRKIEAFRYIEMMNAKYAELGDNPGLNYAIFTKYRTCGHDSFYFNYFKCKKFK